MKDDERRVLGIVGLASLHLGLQEMLVELKTLKPRTVEDVYMVIEFFIAELKKKIDGIQMVNEPNKGTDNE